MREEFCLAWVIAMGKHDHCCVPLCTTRRDDGKMCAFHHFPDKEKKPELREKWIVAIKWDEGEHFAIKSDTVVCSNHFLDKDYAGIIPPRTEEQRRAVAGKRHVYRLTPDAVPFFSSKEKEKAFSARPPPRDRGSAPVAKRPRKEKTLSKEEEEIRTLKGEVERLKLELEKVNSQCDELKTIVETYKSEKFTYASIRSRSSSDPASSSTSSLKSSTSTSKQVTLFEFYTGVSPASFDSLWDFLKPSEENVLSHRQAASVGSPHAFAGRKSILSLHDQLFMVLMRLRLGLLERDLAFRFGVSESTISRLFQKWINYMYLRLGSLPVWPTWERVKETMPACFRETYPTMYMIIDATEIRVEIPGSLSLQSQNYSAYKSHTTHKSLLAIAPNGCIIFASELYTGSISDRSIVIECGILELLKSVLPNRSIMADRGFEIQDLLVASGHVLNIPAFRGADGTLSQQEVIRTQQIARVRIHVERVIGQLKKTFRIFQGVIPLTLESSVNQMWLVACMLVNFKGPITAE